MIQQAIALHQNGRLQDAEQLYVKILQEQHDNFDALHLLGVLMHQRGRSQEALDLIAKAREAVPSICRCKCKRSPCACRAGTA